ncbi:prepilin peptidase [Castellaniella hirudinis]|uniref:prepilin peptidase n=1 Tax=Castellaniella hirudinis TaxID=1144617 RepID=UPI0039C0654A
MSAAAAASLILAGLAAWAGAGFAAWSQGYARRLRAGAAANAETLWGAARRAYGRAPVRWPDALCGALAGGAVFWLSWDQAGLGLAGGVLCLGLGALAFLDWHSGLLPDALTLPLMGLGWLCGPLGLVPAVLLSGLVWCGLAGLAWAYHRMRGQAGLGGGDVKCLAMLAAWLGGPLVSVVLWLACVLGVLWWLSGWAGRRSSYPFGPCLSLAALPWVLLGPDRAHACLGLVLGAV